MKNLFKLFFTYKGRINRLKYLLSSLPLFAMGWFSISLNLLSGFPKILILLLSVSWFYASICIGVKRLHDLNWSGWWNLLMLIPIVNLGLTVVLFCLKGTGGSNKYGPDPLKDTIPLPKKPIVNKVA